MLAQFALTAFVLFAMLSLVIDVGYARLTQVQMQSAADSAALQGLRNRDSQQDATGATSAYGSDCYRRARVNQLVRRVFDDDLDDTNGDPDYQFGAGPIIDVTDGLTNLHAGATLSVPDEHAYKPYLLLNQPNQIDGDMVSGRFTYSDDPSPPEDSTYARTDFAPNSAPPQPPPTLAACPGADDVDPNPWPAGGSGTLANDNAFLVRMRRSNEQPDPTVADQAASSGPTLPLVFGRGTTIFGDTADGSYSVRRDGVTVRATAIAEVRPALRIGVGNGGALALPFVLIDRFVAATNQAGCPVTVTPLTGIVARAAGGPAICATSGIAVGAEVGRFVTNTAAIATVGQVRPAAAPRVTFPAAGFSGYGPVAATMLTSGATRIIGFSRLALGCAAPGCQTTRTTPFTATVFHGISLVANANATAVLSGGLPLPITASNAEVVELLARNRVSPPPGFPAPPNYAPVLVPVLAR